MEQGVPSGQKRIPKGKLTVDLHTSSRYRCNSRKEVPVADAPVIHPEKKRRFIEERAQESGGTL